MDAKIRRLTSSRSPTGTPLFSSSCRRNLFGECRLARLESQREAQRLAPSASSPIRLRCAILVRSPCPPPPPLPSDPSSQTTLPCFPHHLSCHVGVPVIDVACPMRPHVHRTLPRYARGAPQARRERRRAAAAAASAQGVSGMRGHERTMQTCGRLRALEAVLVHAVQDRDVLAGRSR